MRNRSGWYRDSLGSLAQATLRDLIQHAIEVYSGHMSEIARRLGRLPDDILFLSDVVEELDAAREAGLRTVLIDRLDDYPQPRLGDAAHGHARVERFDQITLD